MSSVIKAADIVAAPVEWPERGQPSAAAASAAPVGVEPPALLARTLLDIAPLQAEAMRRASQIVEHARQQADDIVKGAHAAREAVLEEAHSEGYEVGRADGYEAGATAAQQEARARLEALASLLDELGRTRDEIAMRYEEDIVQLALAVAARIVRQESSLGPETVRELLRETLPRTGGTKKITVSIHPDDMEMLERDLHALEAMTDGRAQVEWVADSSISPGGCFVETERGGIDATVETRVSRIVDSLLDVMRRGH